MQSPADRPQVLVVEDEAIIAMDLEGILTDAGLAVPATLPSCAAALEWLDVHLPDVALVDMHLLDGSCEPVAKRLVERGIPFVVFSASTEREQPSDPVFQSAAWLEKPAPRERIVAAIMAAVASPTMA